jgi:hypothetical protein
MSIYKRGGWLPRRPAAQIACAPKKLRLQQRLTAILTRMDQAYLDKLDGKITAEFWERKNAEWL